MTILPFISSRILTNEMSKINIIANGVEIPSFVRQELDCPDVIEKTVKRIPKKYRDDINALSVCYNLSSMTNIKISLQELSQLCERDYIRIESYRGLVNFLKREFGITLFIYSQKTK